MNKWKEYELLKSKIPEGLGYEEYQRQIKEILDKLDL